MSDRFTICHEITAKWEGGWSDHPADPGGKTMYGVTEARWHEYQRKMGKKLTPVRNITKSQALTFYRSEFWDACGAPDLFPGVDLAVYDGGVNSGVSRGRKWLKEAAGSNDHSVTVKRICRARLSFMQSLKIWKTFGKGWGRRAADIEAKGVVMAVTAMGASTNAVKTILADGKAEAQKSAATSDKVVKATGTGAAASGSAPVTLDGSTLDHSTMWLLGALCVALIVVAVVAIAKKKQAKAREQAFAEALA
jgi:lysozyme family protein